MYFSSLLFYNQMFFIFMFNISTCLGQGVGLERKRIVLRQGMVDCQWIWIFHQSKARTTFMFHQTIHWFGGKRFAITSTRYYVVNSIHKFHVMFLLTKFLLRVEPAEVKGKCMCWPSRHCSPEASRFSKPSGNANLNQERLESKWSQPRKFLRATLIAMQIYLKKILLSYCFVSFL